MPPESQRSDSADIRPLVARKPDQMSIWFFFGVAVAGGSRVQVYAPGGYVSERRADEGMRDAGIAVAVLGAVAMAVGIPVWAIGARKEPVKKPETEPAPGSAPPASAPPARAAAIVRVGPGGASFDLTF